MVSQQFKVQKVHVLASITHVTGTVPEMARRLSRRLHLETCFKPSFLPHVRVYLPPSTKKISLYQVPTTHHAAGLFVSFTQSQRVYSSSASDGGSEKMTFEEYRKLRKSLKTRGRVAGLPMAFFGMGISSFVNVHYITPNMFELAPEEVQPILGLDPIVFAALCGVASGMTGYILGGALFHSMWKFLFKKKAAALQERENDFLERIQKYRFSDVSRYDDDYYADKVVTLSDYRQWVRQQQKRQEQLGAAKTATEADTQSTTQSKS